MTDPDAEGGPDPEWFRAELDACRAEIERLRAENAAMRPVVMAAASVIYVSTPTLDRIQAALVELAEMWGTYLDGFSA